VDLSATPRGANPLAGRYLARLADELCVELDARADSGPSDPWLARLHDAIGQSLAKGQARQSAVAKLLAIGTRSLQRALQDRGSSFSSELAAVRKGRALALLRKP
jgi:hypothetical protein